MSVLSARVAARRIPLPDTHTIFEPSDVNAIDVGAPPRFAARSKSVWLARKWRTAVSRNVRNRPSVSLAFPKSPYSMTLAKNA
jgi:hypothetical protein